MYLKHEARALALTAWLKVISASPRQIESRKEVSECSSLTPHSPRKVPCHIELGLAMGRGNIKVNRGCNSVFLIGGMPFQDSQHSKSVLL